MPVEGRKHVLDTQLKIEMNNKSKTLNIEGEGVPTPIRFEPSFIEIGPILPFSAGDEKVVTVISSCEIPIELYSLDFDTQYKEEEMMLTAIGDIMFEGDGCCRVPVRAAGENLQESLVAAYNTVIAPRPESLLDENGEEVEVQEKLLLPSPPLRKVTAPRDEMNHQDILVITPPVCGSSSVASFLSKKLVLPVLNIDTIIYEICSMDGELGYR